MPFDVTVNTVQCFRCGVQYKNRKNAFYACLAQQYKGIGFLHVCKKCVDDIFDSYVRMCGDAKKATRQVCRKLDIIWDPEAFVFVQDRAATKTLMGAYIARVNKGASIGKSYDNTLATDGTLWDFSTAEDREKSAEDLAGIVDAVVDGHPEFKVTQDMIDYWGSSYTPETYRKLEARKRYWMSGFEDVSQMEVGTEALICQICCIENDIDMARANGAPVEKLISSLDTLIKTAQLKPTQKNGEVSKSDVNTPFGVWIKRWEDKRPIPEVDPSCKDVDGIIKYVLTWFSGHLAKMLGIKKAESRLYEEEIARLRVERPEFNDEDDEEFLNDVFSTTGADGSDE